MLGNVPFVEKIMLFVLVSFPLKGEEAGKPSRAAGGRKRGKGL